MLTCTYQIGGSDQMGNIMSGYDLVSRVESKEVFGKTCFNIYVTGFIIELLLIM